MVAAKGKQRLDPKLEEHIVMMVRNEVARGVGEPRSHRSAHLDAIRRSILTINRDAGHEIIPDDPDVALRIYALVGEPELRRRVASMAQREIASSGNARQAKQSDYVEAIRRAIAEVNYESAEPEVPEGEMPGFVSAVFDLIGPGRLGPIEPLLSADVSEIMVNGPDDVWVDYHGQLKRVDVRFEDDAAIRAAIDRIVTADGKLCDESHPLCDCVLHRPGEPCDQSRVNCTLPPISIDHPTIDIRMFRKDITDLEALKAYGTLDHDLECFLNALVQARMNIIIVGGTATGKTTLLNALSLCIPDNERIITIEDTAELSINKPHVLRMQSREANVEGRGEVTIRRVLKNALRQRPDRIIVGECRGEETLEMLQAMSTGHDGSLSTVHANNPHEALERINVMVHYGTSDLTERIVRQIIAGAVDYIIALTRFPDGRRVISEVMEVQEYQPTTDVITTQTIWEFEQTGTTEDGKTIGTFHPTGLIPSDRSMKKFKAANLPGEVTPAWFTRAATNVPVRPRRIRRLS